MRIERTVIAIALSALLYAQAPGVFDTLEADGDARFNGDVVFTTPSGALVSFQSLVNAGVGLPMTIDSDTSTQGYQCPSGMAELAGLRGRFPLGVTPTGTLAATLGGAYSDTDGPVRLGGTAHSGPSYSPPTLTPSTLTIGSHNHVVSASDGSSGGNQQLIASRYSSTETLNRNTSSANTPFTFNPGSFSSGSVTGGGAANQPPPAPGMQVLWCAFE